MNGLLHRLAARASGTAVLLRPDLTLPFGGARFDPDERDAAAPGPWPVVAPAPDATLGAAAARTHAWPRTAARMEPSSPSSRLSEAAAPRAVRPGSADLAAPSNASRDAANTLPPARAAAIALVAVEAVVPPAPPASPPFHESAQWMPATGRPASSAAPQPMRAVQSPPDPAPLLPEARAATPLLRPPVPAPPAARPRSQRGAARHGENDRAAEVHIHIGRIDVTAVHEPAPPRRRVAAPPAPTPLDSYLAKRGPA